jgi:hypothetical protein
MPKGPKGEKRPRDPNPGAQAQPVTVSTNKVRGGVTGHHVRYVLGFGLAGIIFAFIVMGLLFGFGSN